MYEYVYVIWAPNSKRCQRIYFYRTCFSDFLLILENPLYLADISLNDIS